MGALAFCYDQGRGVTRDKAACNEWLLKAADAGHIESQVNVAIMYFTGNGAPKDVTRAIAWLTKAAEAGNADAMFRLGWIYHSGAEGTTPNPEKGVEWLRKAAKAGSELAKNYLNNRGISGG